MASWRSVLVILLALSACAAPRENVGASLAAAQSLHWLVETTNGQFLGSATAVGDQMLLTNRHVVQAAGGAALIVRRGEQTLPVEVQQVSQDADVASLRTAGRLAVFAERLAVVQAGAPLAVAGAIAGQPHTGTGRLDRAERRAPVRDGLLTARLPVAPGFSGGPVVDQDGGLVGLVVATVVGSATEARRLAAAGPDHAPTERPALLVPARTALSLCPREACPALHRADEAPGHRRDPTGG